MVCGHSVLSILSRCGVVIPRVKSSHIWKMVENMRDVTLEQVARGKIIPAGRVLHRIYFLVVCFGFVDES